MRINGDPKFQKMLASNSGGNERLVFSIIGVKVNRKGKSQERALLVTNRAIYNTIPSDIRKCQRRIPLEKLHHLTVSNSCDNFVRAHSRSLNPRHSRISHIHIRRIPSSTHLTSVLQVLHVIAEYDYYFNCPRLEILGRIISDALFQLCNRSLRVDVVTAIDLTDYVISKVTDSPYHFRAFWYSHSLSPPHRISQKPEEHGRTTLLSAPSLLPSL